MRVVLLVAALLMPTLAAHAAPRPLAARWCSVSTGFTDVHWDCRYRTLAVGAAAVGPRSDACLENPNWALYRGRRR